MVPECLPWDHEASSVTTSGSPSPTKQQKKHHHEAVDNWQLCFSRSYFFVRISPAAYPGALTTTLKILMLHFDAHHQRPGALLPPHPDRKQPGRVSGVWP